MSAAKRVNVLSSHILPTSARKAARVVIVGGIVMDVQGCPSGVDTMRGGSVPGHVSLVPGGVARNIAAGVSQLVAPGNEPLFISILGQDALGSMLRLGLQTLRLDTSGVMVCPTISTPCVAAIFDRGGESVACIADVDAVEQHLTPHRLAAFKDQIQQGEILVVETNLTVAALASVCQWAFSAGVAVVLEPVSVPKALRCVPVLRHLSLVSPNLAELVAVSDELRRLAGRSPLPRMATEGRGEGEQLQRLLGQAATFAADLLEAGVCFVVLTMGALGAALIHQPGRQWTPSPSAEPPGSVSQSRQPADQAGSHQPGRRWMSSLSTDSSTSVAQSRHSGDQTGSHESGQVDRLAQSTHRPAVSEFVIPPHLEDYSTDSGADQDASSAPPAREQQTGASSSGAERPSRCPRRVEVAYLCAIPADVVSLSGAGDTLVAGMVGALSRRGDPLQALACGMAAAKRAVESRDNVPATLDFDNLSADAARMLQSIQRYTFDVTQP